MLFFPFCWLSYLYSSLTDIREKKTIHGGKQSDMAFLKLKIFYICFVIGSIILTEVYVNINRVLEHIIME